MLNAVLKQETEAITKENAFIMGWVAYKNYVRTTVLSQTNEEVKDITYWRNELFCNLLTYLLPITILALVPGVYMSFLKGLPFLGIFDLFVFAVLALITLKTGIGLERRKNLLVLSLYGLSIVLLYYLGDMGPGMLYLQALTVTSAVLLSARAAYYSVLFNAIICFLFGLSMWLGFESMLIEDYTADSWIAVSSNLVTLSLVTAISLNLLFKGLETNFNDKKIAENEFKTTYDRLLFHLDNSPLAFIEFDKNMMVQNWSNRAEEIFRWTKKEYNELKEKGISRFYAEDIPLATEMAMQLINGTQERVTLQNRNYTKDGRIIWCEWHTSVLKDNTGKTETILSLVKDITERKEQEETLKRNETRLKEAQATAHLGSWELNFATGIALWSDEACRIYGISPEENKQSYESWLSFIHPDDLEYVLEGSKRAQETLSDSDLIHRIVLRNGTTKYIHSITRFEFDQHKIPVGLYGTSHDVTEQKIAEKNLIKNEAKLKEAQAIAHIANWEIDLAQNKHSWSEEFYIIYGLDKNNVQPSAELFLSLMHPEDMEFAQSKVQEAFDILTNSSFNFRFIRNDGAIRHGYSEWKFEFDKNGDPTRLYGIIQDITEQKNREEMLSKSEANLTAVIENTDASIFSLDNNFRYITFNNVLKNTLKQVYNIDINPGDNVFDFLYKDQPEEAHEWKNIYTEALSGRSLQFEKTFDIGDFHQVTAFSIHPIFEKNEVTGLSCIVRDITKQKKIERNLLDSKKLLTEAQQMAKFGNWNFNFISNESYWSEGMRDMFGLSADDNVGLELFLSMIYPADRERINLRAKETMTTGKKFDEKYRIIRKDGEVRTHNSITWFEKDETGNPLRISGTSQDVTELEHTKNELENALLELENKVESRTKELKVINETLQDEIHERIRVGEVLEEKNKDITDSILYAQRLQNALLPGTRIVEKNFKDSFVFNRPKAIVSGDFYWLHRHCKKIMLACADATGHGVPGAFMSLLGVDLLNRIVVDQEWKHPSLVLEMLDDSLINLLNREKEERVADGIDMVFCQIDTVEKTINFAGAMSSITLISKGKATVYKGSRFALGGYMDTSKKRFETLEIPYNEGDMLYLSSDGFKDQFGGAQNKKLGCRRMLSMLEQIHHLPAAEQNTQVSQVFENWKGDNSQVDDVTLIGVRL